MYGRVPPAPSALPPPAPPEAPPAWQRFAAGFANPQRLPVIAVVVSGLGLSEAATEAAIRRLPPQVTLSFSPYARRLDEWIALARAHGHEVLLELPMEGADDPASDPGPHTLLADPLKFLTKEDFIPPAGDKLLHTLAPDIVFLIGWNQVVRPDALRLATVGWIGAHASLLPRNRGSARQS